MGRSSTANREGQGRVRQMCQVHWAVCGLLSWRQDGALQSWRKEMGPVPAVYMNKKGKNNPEERRLDLAVLEKGDRSLLSWRKEKVDRTL